MVQTAELTRLNGLMTDYGLYILNNWKKLYDLPIEYSTANQWYGSGPADNVFSIHHPHLSLNIFGKMDYYQVDLQPVKDHGSASPKKLIAVTLKRPETGIILSVSVRVDDGIHMSPRGIAEIVDCGKFANSSVYADAVPVMFQVFSSLAPYII